MNLRTRVTALLDSGGSLSVRRLMTKGLWGGVDQMMLSATNFATMVLLARAVSPEEFGSFTIALAFVTFVLALQAGLLHRPYSVISAAREGEAYRRYVSAVGLAQVVSAAAVSVVLLLVALVLQARGSGSAVELTAIAGPAIAGWGLQELVRQILYAEGRLPAALLNDTVSYGLRTLVLVLATMGGALSPFLAMAILAGTSFAAVAVGVVQLRDSLTLHLDWPTLRRDSIENWRFGRWMAGGAGLVGGMELANTTMLAGFVSVAAAGAMRAVTTVMGPTHILLKTMDITLTPMAARIAEGEGAAGLHRFIMRVFWLTTPMMAVYCLLVSVVASPLLRVLYGPEYAGYAWLLQLAALTYLLTHTLKPASIGVSALREASPVFHAQLAQAVLVVTVGAVATYVFGLAGSAVIMAVAAVAQNWVIWRAYLARIAERSPAGFGARIATQGDLDASGVR